MTQELGVGHPTSGGLPGNRKHPEPVGHCSWRWREARPLDWSMPVAIRGRPPYHTAFEAAETAGPTWKRTGKHWLTLLGHLYRLPDGACGMDDEVALPRE